MVIDYNKFKKQIEQEYGSLYSWKQKSNFGSDEVYFSINLEDECVISSVVLSGYAGGSWTGSEPEFFVNNDVIPESFIEYMLEEIILKYRANLGYFKYKKFMRENVLITKVTERGYYGNSNNVTKCSVKILDLYNFLKDE